MFIYQLPVSLYSFKLRLALCLKGLSIELREPPGGTYRSAEYRAIIPSGTIPALIDGDLWLTECDSIIEYLEDRGEGTPLFPTDPADRARTRMLSRWNDLQLEPAIRLLFRQVAPATRDRDAVLEADELISGKLALMEVAIASEGPFALGTTPGMADCGLVASLAWHAALSTPLELTSAAGPKLVRAITAMAAHPAAGPEISSYAGLLGAWVAAKS